MEGSEQQMQNPAIKLYHEIDPSTFHADNLLQHTFQYPHHISFLVFRITVFLIDFHLNSIRVLYLAQHSSPNFIIP